MIKTGVYGMVRTLFWMVPPEVQANGGRDLGLIIACFGVVTLFIGTVQALKQHDAKRLHAYHSIGQMGYILLAIGSAQYFVLSGNALLTTLAVLALVGGLYHAVNHVVFKALLFLCTGSVQYATGTKDLDQLGGLLKLMPITALVAAIASASIAGIPGFSGFVSKWAIIASGLLGSKSAGIIVLFAVIALTTSAITLASYVKFFGLSFTASGIEWSRKERVSEVGVLMLLPMSLLAVLCLAQGLFPGFFVSLFIRVFALSEGSLVQTLFADPATHTLLAWSWSGVSLTLAPGSHPVAFVMPLVLLAMFCVAGLVGAWLRRAGGAEQREAPVWLCGYQTLNGTNSYTSSHVYAAFKRFMWWTGGNVRGASKF
jgi:hydrogenase-4 component B